MPDAAAHTGPEQTRAPKARRKLRWERTFLKELVRLGNVTAACDAADVGRATVYEHADRHPDFKEAWQEALEAAADLLELEARRRAHDGIDEPVIYQGELCGAWVDGQGNAVAKDTPGARLIPLTVKKYSDSLLMFLLKAHRPDKFRERSSVEHSGQGGEPIPIRLVEVVKPDGKPADRNDAGRSPAAEFPPGTAPRLGE
jgi:hypothetical protein